MNKEIRRNLYKKYQELMRRTKRLAHRMKPGEKVKVQHISLKDLEELDETEKKLKNCLDLLSDNELIELMKISKDEEINENVEKILRKRKGII